MAISRQARSVPIGDRRVKHRVVVLDDPCPKGTREASIRYHAFLTLLADQHYLLGCGFMEPERIVIEHNGVAWQATAEAEGEEQSSG